MPKKIAYFVTERTADVAYFTFYKKARGIVGSNFEIILNHKLTPYEKRKVAFQTFRNFADFIYEYAIIQRLTAKNLTNYLNIICKERLDEVLKQGRGAIVLTGHLGNWEWASAMIALLGYSHMGIALPHPSEKIETYFVKRRESVGIKITDVGKSMRKPILTLKRNGVVTTLGDRDYLDSDNWFDFFGQRASFPRGIFELAHRLETPVIPAFCVKDDFEQGKYNVFFEEPISFHNIETGTKKWIEILEKYIRRYPTQWYVFDPIWEDS